LAKRHERREEAQKSLEQAEAAGTFTCTCCLLVYCYHRTHSLLLFYRFIYQSCCGLRLFPKANLGISVAVLLQAGRCSCRPINTIKALKKNIVNIF